MSNRLLEINDLEVIYKTDVETIYAVNGVSLTLRKGKTIGIVGETGAGKTTLALSILRLLPERTGKIVNGSIKFHGRDVLKASGQALRGMRGNEVAMVFQDPMTSLDPIMTIGRQIGETLSLHNDGWSKGQIETRVDEVLTLVGISPDRKHEYPHQFSGGMKQRVVIAIALACEPELLIADEPTTALDVTIQAQVLRMINQLVEEQQTSMIMITHDLGIVAATCDDVAIMYAGKIVELSTAEEMFTSKHHHPYTQGLFGSIPNIKEKTKRLLPIPGLMPDPTELPKGCKFAPRCPRRMDICDIEEPGRYTVGTQMISCHLFSTQGKQGGESDAQ